MMTGLSGTKVLWTSVSEEEMMSRKFFIIVLILFTLNALFGSCDHSNNNVETSVKETTLLDVDESMIEDFVELTFILVGGTKNFLNKDWFDDEKVGPPMDLINEKLLEELNTNIKFRWIYSGENDSYQNSIIELYHAGISFDAFTYHNVLPFINNGIAMDLTDSIMNVRYIKSFYDDTELKNSPYIAQNKKIYAIPAICDRRSLRSITADMLNSILIPRSDEKFFPLAPLASHEDLLNYASSVKTKQTEAEGLNCNINSYLRRVLPMTTNLFHYYNNIFILDQDMNVTWFCDTPHLHDIFYEYYNKFHVDEIPDSTSRSADMIFDSNDITRPLYRRPNDGNKLLDKNFDFSYVVMDYNHVPIKNFPGYSAQNFETRIFGNMDIYGEAVDDLLIIPATCQNPDRVLLFLDWLYSDRENYNLFRYGHEKINYYKDDAGRIYVDLSNNVIYKWKGFSFFINPYLDNFNIPGVSLGDVMKKRQYTPLQRQVLTSGEQVLNPSEDELLEFQILMNEYNSEYDNLLKTIDKTRNIDEALKYYQEKFKESDRQIIEDFIKQYTLFFIEHYGVSFKEN